MSISASKRKLGGTVIDGVCRDIPMIKKLSYNIFTKGHYMVTGKDRVEVDAVNVPVSISGVQVKHGDIILGDDTGVICIPSEAAERVLAVAMGNSRKRSQDRGRPLCRTLFARSESSCELSFPSDLCGFQAIKQRKRI